MLHEYSPPKGILLHLVSRRSAVRHVANVSLMSYYATVRDKITSTPAEKVMPRLRAMLADLMYSRADVLRDPAGG